MRVKTKVKAGGREVNHNQTTKGLRVKSNVKAGDGGGDPGRIFTNHNQTVKGLRVKSKVKAGGVDGQHNQTLAGKR
ncbi:MAG TPA: hypothetical protein VN282_18620 [Pyrinomonadaceae bacterium]|nr:hypothetical protein [Pyrinomonadaceae bacterium]